ncbi:helix-turn-helix domain-containing protein [Amycolatopsis sp. H20-H5]|uniref:helix-turn-helix domain-containing protein n=1 Tax=Amycolatopsis sp. H20-H5 TaxID=3046309 RepID=UPI002DBC306A|nr:Scr1 family TA system antitoxin-like transcriptional regulator [Amycolatopsis sp. H20-H5]MEC3978060.1 Scr1 family TA system antitoxin-like transcriptional regulator [Amycolatopsis sp. H20-H5]
MTSLVLQPSVATQRKRLGMLVRQARKDMGITQVALGGMIGCRQSKINKIEGGQCGLKPSDLESIVASLDIDPVTAAQMRVLNIRDTPQRVRSDGRVATPPWFVPILDEEREVTEMFSWTGERIPGLLQSEYYMLAQFQAAGAADVATPIVERISRQQIFDSNSDGRYEFLISEAALNRMMESLIGAIALDQLYYMLDLMKDHPSVRVRMVPYGAAAYVDPDYTILRFADHNRDFAYMESISGLVLAKGQDLQKYEDSCDALRYLALSVSDTKQRFGEKIGQLAAAEESR